VDSISNKKYPGEITIIALGALSNIALACDIDNKFANNVKHLVYMGMGNRLPKKQTELFPFTEPDEVYAPGKVYMCFPNHNISSDTWAAVKVFESAMSISVINDAVTNELWWAGESAAKLRKAETIGEFQVVGKLLDVWLKYRTSIFCKEIKGTCPHDAITTIEAIYPEKYVEYIRGHLMIHEWAGFSSFVTDPLGPHRIGVKMKPNDIVLKEQPSLGINLDDIKLNTTTTDNNSIGKKDYDNGTNHLFIQWLSSILSPPLPTTTSSNTTIISAS